MLTAQSVEQLALRAAVHPNSARRRVVDYQLSSGSLLLVLHAAPLHELVEFSGRADLAPLLHAWFGVGVVVVPTHSIQPLRLRATGLPAY